MDLSNTTKLAMELVFNCTYESGSGHRREGFDFCTDFIYTYDKGKKSLKIPYDAHNFLEMAKHLIYRANVLINEDVLIEDIVKLKKDTLKSKNQIIREFLESKSDTVTIGDCLMELPKI